MKRSFLNCAEPAAVLAIFLLGLLLPAGARAQTNNSCTGSSSAQVNAQAQRHGTDQGLWLRIFAFTDAPVVGADVRVTLHGRLLVDAKAATNNRGGVPARVWRPWLLDEEAAGDANAPERDGRRRRPFVRISVSGGTLNGDPFLGHLSADVTLTDPVHQILVVNPVTTLVSRVLDERPELELDAAEALVRRFLELPANYSLGLALRESAHYVSPFFSPIAFMAEAGDAGGLDAFEHLLLQELGSPSATHSFPPRLLRTTASTLAAGLYAGALDVASAEGVENLAGWAMSLTGLVPTSETTQADIDALTGALSDLQSSVDALCTEVAQLTQLVQSTATQTQYDTIVHVAQPLANNVTGYENDISSYAQFCPPLPASSVPPPPNLNQAWCDKWGPIYNQELILSYENRDFENLEGYIEDSGMLGTGGMLHLYSLWLGQTERFFTAADSTNMQNLYNYWDGVLTSAANVRMELFHQQGDQNTPAGQQQIISFIGNPDAAPPTKGVFQADQAANLQLMFPAVPVGTVINTKDHFMWDLNSPLSYVVQPVQQSCSVDPLGPWFELMPYPLAGPWGQQVIYGLPGWNSPDLSEMQALIDGWTGASPMSWLVAQGFQDLTNGCGIGERVWTQTWTGHDSGSYQIDYLMDLATGNVDSTNGVVYPCPPGPNCYDNNHAHFHWMMIDRGLARGEQYYWYQ